jgi:hypothetical protein
MLTVKRAVRKRSDRLRPTHAYRWRTPSNAFHQARSSRHSNQFATKPLFLNSSSRPEISTGLADQGSQVRVLSPRRTRNLITVTGGWGLPDTYGTSEHLTLDAGFCLSLSGATVAVIAALVMVVTSFRGTRLGTKTTLHPIRC